MGLGRTRIADEERRRVAEDRGRGRGRAREGEGDDVVSGGKTKPKWFNFKTTVKPLTGGSTGFTRKPINPFRPTRIYFFFPYYFINIPQKQSF